MKKQAVRIVLSLGLLVLLTSFVYGQTAAPLSSPSSFSIITPDQISTGGSASDFDSMPSSYDLRTYGYVTSVKNQGNCGSCWTFATCASMESAILVDGGSTYDFSENNLDNNSGFDWGPCGGGNSFMSIAYLSRLDGPGAEAEDPYTDYNDSATAPTTITRTRFLTNANYYYSTAAIKNAVTTTGALYTSMHYDDSYMNYTNNTYCYTGSSDTNHAVTIVGWDDSKITDGGTGAWLIKNSWGSSWGDNGYVWVSYNDAKACDYGVSFETAAADTVNSVYYHDSTGWAGYSVNASYGCNVFDTTTADELTAVGFYTIGENASYEIRIYGDWDNGAPTDLLLTQTGTIDYSGFHVVDLESLVSVGENDEFAVYLYIDDGSGSMAIECPISGYNSEMTLASEGCYVSMNGSSWTDLGSALGANLCIKVYGVPEPSQIAMLLGLAAMFWVRRRWRR